MKSRKLPSPSRTVPVCGISHTAAKGVNVGIGAILSNERRFGPDRIVRELASLERLSGTPTGAHGNRPCILADSRDGAPMLVHIRWAQCLRLGARGLVGLSYCPQNRETGGSRLARSRVAERAHSCEVPSRPAASSAGRGTSGGTAWTRPRSPSVSLRIRSASAS